MWTIGKWGKITLLAKTTWSHGLFEQPQGSLRVTKKNSTLVIQKFKTHLFRIKPNCCSNLNWCLQLLIATEVPKSADVIYLWEVFRVFLLMHPGPSLVDVYLVNNAVAAGHWFTYPSGPSSSGTWQRYLSNFLLKTSSLVLAIFLISAGSRLNSLGLEMLIQCSFIVHMASILFTGFILHFLSLQKATLLCIYWWTLIQCIWLQRSHRHKHFWVTLPQWKTVCLKKKCIIM